MSGHARMAAVVKSALFAVVAPGFFIVFLPWWLVAEWPRPLSRPLALFVAGTVVAALGAAVVLVSILREFAWRAGGTPAPPDAPPVLVVTGLYRYVRNPMYVGVALGILGQVIAFWWSPGLLIELALVVAAFVAFVRLYEEPTLRRRFGAAYEEYRRNVPAWIPRWTPWSRTGSGSAVS